MLAGFGMAASASQMNTDGPVDNSDYRNQDVMLNVTRRLGERQSLALHGDFDSSENGVPGPYGSDPMHTFTGIDTISRNKNNFSDYSAHYQADLSRRVREELSGAFFLNNNGFTSPYPFALNKDLRAHRREPHGGQHYGARCGGLRIFRRRGGGPQLLHHRRRLPDVSDPPPRPGGVCREPAASWADISF